MKREWKAGDLAMSRSFGVLLAGDDGFWYAKRGRLSTPWRAMGGYLLFDDLRPLALIDPEAAIPDEWLRVFYSAWMAADFGDEDEDHRAGLSALFAHIAAPPEPKPEEPTGDRATVRDRDGVLWTRDEEPVVEGYRWVDVSAGRNAAWSDLDVPADGVLWGGVKS